MTDEGIREDPRVTRSRAAVLEAAVRELAEEGYGGFTIDGVATRSGVARSTIYRLWPERADLVVAALRAVHPQPTARDDSREDVRALLGHLDSAFNDSLVAECLPAIIEGSERDPAFRAVHHAANDARRARLVRAVRRGVDDGDWPDTDAELAALALVGALVYARLMTSRRLAGAELDRLIGVVLGGPATGPASAG
ncbi:TetR/AcrR family transcriptional regulator [Nocardioides sp. SYSU D00038]|uniref:TetR/AcrR family transcriptional regulator n=1 Tax=Nocardioides sp. SYSU D00038 TaxID=2812554 RepID=UPI0019686DCF|nr:TetR/AcrR family transcriptional regulator [Nocardioides sp. SYSU D00038]